MDKSKKIVSLLVLAVFIIQSFFGPVAALEDTMPTTGSTVVNTSGNSTGKQADAKATGSFNVLPTPISPAVTVTNTGNTVKATGNDVSDISNGMGKNIKKNKIIVKYKDINKAEDSKERFSSRKPSLKLSSKKTMKRFKMENIEVTGDEDVKDIINELKSDPNVEYAQEDYLLETCMVPQETRFAEQWSLSNTGQTVNGQAGVQDIDINAVDAWDITTGSDSVTVAVIDTGVDPLNTELASNIYVNTKEKPDGIDNDLNGLIDDVQGFNFADGNNSIFRSASEDAHGTHIAGIIGAGLNNSGIAGIAPNIKILPVKFISGNTGFTSDAVASIEYAVSMGARIISCSWGGDDYNQALRDVIANSNALFIVAAGNSGRNIDETPVYPACYSLPNIITVGAIDNKGELASFSNYGSKVDIAAPGVNILSTLPENNYGYMSGTSMAVPMISGTLALLLSKEPSLSVSDLKARILNNTTYQQNLTGKVATSGRLNAAAALLNNAPSVTVQPTASPKSKEPGPVYDTSASGNNKIIKPLVENSNPFIDAVINKGVSNVSSAGNGIDNLSINRVKQNFITVTWTTSVLTDAELDYGNTESVGQSCKADKLTYTHQITIMEENPGSVNYYKVKSVAQTVLYSKQKQER